MSENYNLWFSERLNQALKDSSTSGAELASHLNVSPAAVSKWRNGERLPKMEKLQRITDFLGVSPDYFIKQEEYTPDKRKILFDLSAKASEEDLDFAIAFLEKVTK